MVKQVWGQLGSTLLFLCRGIKRSVLYLHDNKVSIVSLRVERQQWDTVPALIMLTTAKKPSTNTDFFIF